MTPLPDQLLRPPVHPRIRLWLELGAALAVAAETGAKRIHLAMRPKRKGSYRTRRPGYDTPLWNVCATLIKAQLLPRGAKVRLARYLGVPRQRLHNFLTDPSRMPDAELTLRLLHWLVEKRAGRDISI